jgi:hypothetical protein
MRLNVKGYDIDDYDVDMIEEQIIATIHEELEIRYDISFRELEKESQLTLVSELFERLKNDIEEEAF